MTHVVGIGEIVISSDTNDKIITHALGSCVAVTFHCPQTRVSGMIHIALPSSTGNKMPLGKPGYFADEGLNYLIGVLDRTYQFNFSTAEVKVIGGAMPSKTKDVFKIGSRNIEAVSDILTKYGIKFHNLDISGTVSRTVELRVNSGEIFIKRQPLII